MPHDGFQEDFCATPEQIVNACGWPSHKGTVIVVGHQPDLGRVAALLVGGTKEEWTVKKGGLWWLAPDEVRAVISPDLL